LKWLDLWKNQLAGPIPDFSRLPNLQRLNLSYNQLTGTIPNFSNLPNFKSLRISNNQLTGSIPDFTSLPNLETLSIGENQLTGQIPNFSNLPNLEEFYLRNNQLTGTIPDFSNLPNLQELYLEDNPLTIVVQVILEKDSYQPGEYFKAELTETLGEDYDLYAAILLPNGTDFIALENTNQFAQLNQPKKWSAPRKQESIKLLSLILPKNLITGRYCLYGILSPKYELVLEMKEQWVMDRQCFDIYSTPKGLNMNSHR